MDLTLLPGSFAAFKVSDAEASRMDVRGNVNLVGTMVLKPVGTQYVANQSMSLVNFLSLQKILDLMR